MTEVQKYVSNIIRDIDMKGHIYLPESIVLEFPQLLIIMKHLDYKVTYIPGTEMYFVTNHNPA
ncbi:hypothetical protein IACHDJAJ_00023 [Aeromonas phage vB_AdhS_TS3]|nr:hypothetical protein IACHDJAJ_00023 [Aeromonas phage vB_AdhS_TS3]